MATVTNPGLSNQSSPRSSAPDASNSPRSRRAVAARGVQSPWNQIVRGESESSLNSNTVVPPSSSPSPSSSIAATEHIAPSSPSSDASTMMTAATALAVVVASSPEAEVQTESSDNGNAGKKQVWNKPSNGGAVEASSTVMGGSSSWPALHESTKASLKSSSFDSLKACSDGSVSAPQGTGMSSSSSSPHKHAISNGTQPNPTTRHMGPNRQRSVKRGGGSGSSSNNVLANGGFSQAALPEGSVVETSPNNSSGKNVNPAVESSNFRDNTHRAGFFSQSHSGNEHYQPRNPSRRGNGGPHPRGDGSHHHGYGGRRDQDRGNQDWSQPRNFGPRDNHMQPHRIPSRPYMRGPPPVPPPYIPPMRPYGPPLVYPDVSPLYFYPHPEPFRPMPMYPSMVFPIVPDPQLASKIVNQIDYYFSDENLVRDTYLRKKMDEQGWVSVAEIATFNKVAQLTNDVQLILQALKASSIVEVQGDKLRRRDNWMRWLLPRSSQFSAGSSSQAPQDSGHDLLSANLQGVTLDEKKTHGEAKVGSPSSGESSNLQMQSHGGVTTQVVQDAQSTSATNM